MESAMIEENANTGLAHLNMQQYLTFSLSHETYGVNILSIKEIIDYGNVTKVPLVADFIAGVINLRGSVVPVIDLALRFSKPSLDKTKRSSIVLLELKHEDQVLEVGVTVDEVNEVVDIASDEIEPAPSFGTQIRTDFISGMGKIDKQLLILLNIDSILSIDELSVFSH